LDISEYEINDANIRKNLYYLLWLLFCIESAPKRIQLFDVWFVPILDLYLKYLDAANELNTTYVLCLQLGRQLCQQALNDSTLQNNQNDLTKYLTKYLNDVNLKLSTQPMLMDIIGTEKKPSAFFPACSKLPVGRIIMSDKDSWAKTRWKFFLGPKGNETKTKSNEVQK
jgi:hypothetical protein